MKCAVCGKECDKELCHACAIEKAKTNLSIEDLKIRRLTKTAEVDAIEDLNPLWKDDVKITYNCTKCGKKYTRTLGKIKQVDMKLLCRRCSYESVMLEKYGVSNSFQKESTKQTIKKTCREKYGCDYFLQTETARESRKLTNKDWLQTTSLSEYSDTQMARDTKRYCDENGVLHYSEITCTCNKCRQQYTTNARRLARCPKCYPEDWANGVSKLEKNITTFVKSIYNGPIFENDRTAIAPKELDIYLPEEKLAIEFDGDWYHGCHSSKDFTELKKRADLKRLMCKEKGIRLITIKECDFKNKPSVIENFLCDLLQESHIIPARSTTIREIDGRTAKAFCEQYHLNGYRKGSTKLGMFHGDELIAVAIFSKHPKYENECIRLCFKTHVRVIGGWDKIRKHYNKPFLHYVDLQYFEGENKTGCGYRYVKNNEILCRQEFQKSRIQKHIAHYDNLMSLQENALRDGWTIIFDCGNDIRLY